MNTLATQLAREIATTGPMPVAQWMARALGDIRPSQLSDPNLFNFMALGKRGDDALPDAHAWLASSTAGDVDA